MRDFDRQGILVFSRESMEVLLVSVLLKDGRCIGPNGAMRCAVRVRGASALLLRRLSGTLFAAVSPRRDERITGIPCGIRYGIHASHATGPAPLAGVPGRLVRTVC